MLTGGPRKLLLTAHVIASVGWLGGVVAYLALTIAGGADASMHRIGWYVLVPFAGAAFVTGVVQGLATEWGLFRSWWVIAKLAITTLGSVVLVLHLGGVMHHGHGDGEASHVVHATGGLVLLVAATALSIFKPWGRRARYM